MKHKRLWWLLLVVAALALCGMALLPGFAAWVQLNEVQLTPDCEAGSCDMRVTLERRFGTFALSTDATRSMPLSGTLQIRCADGQQFTSYLVSPNGPGIFQSLRNPCVDLDATGLTVHIESVQPPEDDHRLGVHLTVFAARF